VVDLLVVVVEVAPVFHRVPERAIHALQTDGQRRSDRHLDAEGELVLVGSVDVLVDRLELSSALKEGIAVRRAAVCGAEIAFLEG